MITYTPSAALMQGDWIVRRGEVLLPVLEELAGWLGWIFPPRDFPEPSWFQTPDGMLWVVEVMNQRGYTWEGSSAFPVMWAFVRKGGGGGAGEWYDIPGAIVRAAIAAMHLEKRELAAAS